MPPTEVAEARDSIAVITGWLVRFQRQVEAIHTTTKAAEGAARPDILPPAKLEPAAAGSDRWSDLDIPAYLDRREGIADEFKTSTEAPDL